MSCHVTHNIDLFKQRLLFKYNNLILNIIMQLKLHLKRWEDYMEKLYIKHFWFPICTNSKKKKNSVISVKVIKHSVIIIHSFLN